MDEDTTIYIGMWEDDGLFGTFYSDGLHFGRALSFDKTGLKLVVSTSFGNRVYTRASSNTADWQFVRGLNSYSGESFFCNEDVSILGVASGYIYIVYLIADVQGPTTTCGAVGNPVSFSVSAINVDHIQWQSSSDSVTFSDIIGEIRPTYTFTGSAGNINMYYRAIINSAFPNSIVDISTILNDGIDPPSGPFYTATSGIQSGAVQGLANGVVRDCWNPLTGTHRMGGNPAPYDAYKFTALRDGCMNVVFSHNMRCHWPTVQEDTIRPTQN